MTNNYDGDGYINECEKLQPTESSWLVNYFPLSDMSLMHISFNISHHNRINGDIE